VAGGAYYRTYANPGTGPTGEADIATVSTFRLDKFPVTVGRFRQFVAAWNAGSGWTPPAGSGKHAHLNSGLGLIDVGASTTTTTQYETGWAAADSVNIAPTNANLICKAAYNTWTDAAGTQENLPMNCVNWYEAYAFCIWDGGFLPTESEWEYAAAGGSEQREYPWGSTAPGSGNQYAIYGFYYPSGTATPTGTANVAPVGTATSGAGLWGQLDLAGEMGQHVLDWYASYVDPCTDCALLTSTSTNRAGRGTSFDNAVADLLVANRGGQSPAGRWNGVGFRCARTP